MSKSIEELESRIRELEMHIERMHSSGSGGAAITGTIGSAPSKSGSLTIFGIEEMILEVGEDDAIGFVNPPMAKVLGIPDRKKALGSPLSVWDKGLIGEGVLTALVDIARSSGAPHLLERECPNLPSELLPEIVSSRPATAPILRFSATPVKGRIHIVAQDITLLRWLENTFSRYVSPAVIQRMQNMDIKDIMKMERKVVTILFGDLRGFTKMSQGLTPEGVQQTVNSFLERMVLAIEKNNGTIDKFVGDEVMAMFGAPLPDDSHALMGLCAAADMQASHLEWIEERKKQGLPAPPLGIGIATGEVVVGNMGTPTRMDYTCLGHWVNLAARLCGSAEGGETLTIGETHRKALDAVKTIKPDRSLPRFHFSPKGKMSFKNVDKPIEVIAVSTK